MHTMFLIPWRGARLVAGIVRLEVIGEEVGAALPALVVVVVEERLGGTRLPWPRGCGGRLRQAERRGGEGRLRWWLAAAGGTNPM